jgi:hypothetical protein
MLEPPAFLDLSTLLSYHKQEGSEELTYFTIIFTGILGILGYIGSARRIEPQVRIAVAIIFSIFLASFTSALVGSLHIHNALHAEISKHVGLHPELFIDGQKSELYNVLTELKPIQPGGVILLAAGLGITVVMGLLTIGEGRVFSFKRILKEKPRRVIDED